MECINKRNGYNKKNKFDSLGEHRDNVLRNAERQTAVKAIEENCEKVLTPLRRFEHALHPWVSFFIIPLFALANAGVTLADMNILKALLSPVSLGIITGLFVGKQIGIFAFSFLAVKFKLASLIFQRLEFRQPRRYPAFLAICSLKQHRTKFM